MVPPRGWAVRPDPGPRPLEPSVSLDLDHAVAVLKRTPRVLSSLLHGLPDRWVRGREGDESWSPFDVVGHLIHGERTDWIPRTRAILEHGPDVTFEPFDRFAMFEASRGKSLEALLTEFVTLRAANLTTLAAFEITAEALGKTGRHPELGVVTLRELLATWVAHDLSHLGQIARVMAKQCAGDVGPWSAYLPILRR